MIISRATKMTHRRSLYFFTVIVTFIILTWIHKFQKDKNIISKSLENRSKLDISLDIRTHRLLAKNEYQNDFTNRGLRKNVSYNRDNYNIEKGKRYKNTFEQLKQGRSNHVDSYLKSYKTRYCKKRGLQKFDCYYEKILFNSINKIEKLGEQKNIGKNRVNRIIFLKYALPFILLSLLPIFTLAIRGIKYGWMHTKVACTKEESSEKLKHNACKGEFLLNDYPKYIYLLISVTLIISLIIYTYIKILKYKRIRKGMLK
ncbi:hypothetical protein PVNG_06275 [Plasmodium vivax North Korean]|uniref:Fam-l protein n=1 Tax=Plasmodium vivax North Korean TaxID=1035514 RepID=A0A0J9TN16_PLAVI|nr:hypothetical protein PVNG_06275 [Plasmodium vivax North Korean]